MATPRSADEPDLDAVRNGAPVDDGGSVDARLVAAERVIAQLRLLLGVLVDDSGGSVTLSKEQLLRVEARGVRIVDSLAGVTLSLPDADRRRLRVAPSEPDVADDPGGPPGSQGPHRDPEASHDTGPTAPARGDTDTGEPGTSTDTPAATPADELAAAGVVPTPLQRRIARILAEHVTGTPSPAPDDMPTPTQQAAQRPPDP